MLVELTIDACHNALEVSLRLSTRDITVAYFGPDDLYCAGQAGQATLAYEGEL